MGDYFALLAARLAGAPDAVRPRTPARFEPSQSADGPSELPAEAAAVDDDVGSSGITEIHTEIPAAVQSPRRLPQRRAAPSSLAMLQGDPIANHPPTSAKAAERLSSRHLPARVATPKEIGEPPLDRAWEPAPPVALPKKSTRAPDRREPPISADDSLANDIVEELGQQRPVRASRPVPPTALPEPARAPATEPRKAPSTLLPFEDRESRHTHPPTDDPADLKTPSDASAPRSDRARETRVEVVAPPSALPAIQITIGRIEVQAVTPRFGTPAPAPRRPTGPTLTLEAYLAQRNGGEK